MLTDGWYQCVDIQEWRRDYRPDRFGAVRLADGTGTWIWAIYEPVTDSTRGKLYGWNGGAETLEEAQEACDSLARTVGCDDRITRAEARQAMLVELAKRQVVGAMDVDCLRVAQEAARAAFAPPPASASLPTEAEEGEAEKPPLDLSERRIRELLIMLDEKPETVPTGYVRVHKGVLEGAREVIAGLQEQANAKPAPSHNGEPEKCTCCGGRGEYPAGGDAHDPLLKCEDCDGISDAPRPLVWGGSDLGRELESAPSAERAEKLEAVLERFQQWHDWVEGGPRIHPAGVGVYDWIMGAQAAPASDSRLPRLEALAAAVRNRIATTPSTYHPSPEHRRMVAALGELYGDALAPEAAPDENPVPVEPVTPSDVCSCGRHPHVPAPAPKAWAEAVRLLCEAVDGHLDQWPDFDDEVPSFILLKAARSAVRSAVAEPVPPAPRYPVPELVKVGEAAIEWAGDDDGLTGAEDRLHDATDALLATGDGWREGREREPVVVSVSDMDGAKFSVCVAIGEYRTYSWDMSRKHAQEIVEWVLDFLRVLRIPAVLADAGEAEWGE